MCSFLMLKYPSSISFRMYLDRLGSVDGHGTANERSEAIAIHTQFGNAYMSECSSAPWKACISLRECLQVQQTAKAQGPDQGDGSEPGHKGTRWLFSVCVSVV